MLRPALAAPAVAAFIALALAASPAPAATSTWEIDSAHSSAGFSVRHLMVSTVRGSFGAVSGKVVVDEADLTKSTVEVEIDAKSINTGNAKRDDHLRNPDFFDVEKYPTITFRSTAVQGTLEAGLTVVGDLTMHGVTKPVTLKVEPVTPPMKDPWGRTVRGASATGTLDRSEWGLTYNTVLEAGGVAVSDEVKLQLDVELVKAEPKPEEPASAAAPAAGTATAE